MSVLKTAIRFIALTIVYFVSFVVVSGALLSSASSQDAPPDARAALSALLLVSLINTAVWTYVILRSRWTGWKLMVTVFLVFYGVSTLMPQIESAYFITRLPPGMLPRLFLAGLIIAATFAPLGVLILGKAKPLTNKAPGPLRLNFGAGAWIGKLALIAVVYVVIYFTFGYFIAWRSAAVRAYYGGSDPAGFISHIRSLLHDEPLLFGLQILRGVLWAAIAVPIIEMTKGKWGETGLAVVLLFAVMTSQLLLPNPLMPADVRIAHLIETASSNFLFGWLVVLILLSTSPGLLALTAERR
jgi:hypothetical protein